ncbi:hypothetical protein IZ6_26220 [Terrihabitans soli]|uniref:Uncharacterized protein n=1 Tax=Terrihabitans soli TaxID=708113 RepID=A0A6S6QVD6_9HYPH|nr:hypothetical protein [Terrihabitans soli]BCJ91887.1 hypothetical protein IZ6_26220 [Terrihabitans soli]
MRTALFAIALASLPAFAQAAEPQSDDRFQIEKSGDNYIRLDRKTGTMSTCTLSGADLDCRASADERAALQAEIDRLSGEVERLKAGTPETASGASISKDGKELTLKLPSEAEIKQVVAFFEDMLQRMVNAVKDLANGNA